MKFLNKFHKEKPIKFLLTFKRRLWRLFVFFGLMIFSVFLLPLSLRSASVDEIKNSLQQELNQIQQQINEYKEKIGEVQVQSKTLKREIQLFDSKIQQAELEIQQTELVLQQSQISIDEKTMEINAQEARMDRERNLLAQYIRSIYESDQKSLIGIIFSQESLSDIFNEMNSLEIVQEKTLEVISQIRLIKESLETEKEELFQKQEEEMQLKALQEIQRISLSRQQLEKKNLLAETKGREDVFQKSLEAAKADAAAIRNQIYLLEGVGLSMTLEEAYKHAKYASGLTGVRPALLLAVLKKESSWGTSVGTGNWRSDMHPRDKNAFLQICDELGFDPDEMPVSRKPSYGWGGAMGPAQFLPSTWLAYKDEVARLTGHNPPSPWDIGDAFVAAGLKLANGGASQGTYYAEWKAAMIYFAGRNWNKSVYSFYGDAVMELAGIIQEQLDLMNQP